MNKVHGYSADLDSPQLFSEKLLFRILRDKDPYYPMYGKKLQAPYFLAGSNFGNLRFAKRLQVRHRISPSDFVDLPESFVLKSSFGSGLNKVVTDLKSENLMEICDEFNSRLPELANAQGDTDPTNCVIFEAFLGDPKIGSPSDYKFHIFSVHGGAAKVFLQVDSDRFGEHRQSFFDENYQQIDLSFSGKMPHASPPDRPENLQEMLSIGRALAEGFDYIRVDLFSVDGQIYFGELTPFHQGGMGKVINGVWGKKLGDLWNIRLPTYQC